MITENIGLRRGDVHIEVTFLIFNKLSSMRKHIVETGKERGVHEDQLEEYKNFLAYCDQPNVSRKDPRQTFLEIEIGLALEEFNEFSLWHELYHALSHIHLLFDNFSENEENAYHYNEEKCANLAGALISETRKQVLPRIRRAIRCRKTKTEKSSKKSS